MSGHAMPPAAPVAIVGALDDTLSPWPGGFEVLAGTLEASGRTLVDRPNESTAALKVGVFACDEDVTLRYEHKLDETIYLAEGELDLEFEDGRKLEVRPGQYAVLGAGQTTVWTIRAPFRELFVLSGSGG